MTITLAPEQHARLSAYVTRGDFSSVEEAVRQLLDERILERDAEESDDLAWARPYVDEARAEAARGNVIFLEEHEARNDARLASIKS
jgi:antitoxin ParD1/3/4